MAQGAQRLLNLLFECLLQHTRRNHPYDGGIIQRHWLQLAVHSRQEGGHTTQPENQIQQDRDFDTWTQMGHRRPACGNNLLHQTYTQHDNRPHGSPDILATVEGGLAVQLRTTRVRECVSICGIGEVLSILYMNGEYPGDSPSLSVEK